MEAPPLRAVDARRQLDDPALVLGGHRAERAAAVRRQPHQLRAAILGHRPPLAEAFVDQLRDQAAFWGWSIGTAYGEPFASRESLGLTSLRDLL